VFPAAIEYLAGPVVIHPNEYYEKVGPKGMNEKPVGSGPYRVTNHVFGKSITLEKNPDYFKDSPKGQVKGVQKIEIRIIPDRQTQLAELLSGGVEFVMNVRKDQADQVKSVPNLQVVSGETMRIAFLHFNAQEASAFAPLKDVRVRRALNHAIDRESMVKNLVGESARVIHTICFPSQFGCTDEGAPRYEYNVQKAKQMLAEAGYPNGFEVPLVAYRERDQTEAMIGYLKAVGVKANLSFLQYAAMREQVRANKVGLAHQTWGSFSVNDVSASTPYYFGMADDDMTHDKEVKALLDTGGNSVDPERAQGGLQEGARAHRGPGLHGAAVLALDLLRDERRARVQALPDEMPRFWEMTWK
jgi:peptide/nickel transport system substrate-binding protein